MATNSAKVPERVPLDFGRHIPLDQLPQFRKKVTTGAIRMDGPFTVETSEGELRCGDGWLCFDARGYPYPVAAAEFELIYEPVEEARPEQALHPATEAILVFFAYEHLPASLAKVSKPFGDLARTIARTLQGPEATVALRKLLEAKDCAVRAALPTGKATIPRD
jgi:hypothetical protein